MSHGALKTKDGEYFSIESQRNASPEDFEDASGIVNEPLLMRILGTSNEGIDEINNSVGRLVMAIQDASFVGYDTMNEFKIPQANIGKEDSDASTLSSGILVATIRRHITDLVKTAIRQIPKVRHVADDFPDDVTDAQKADIINEHVSIGTSVADNGELAHMDLLTFEVRQMLDRCGSGYADEINRILIEMAQIVLNRARLSYPRFLFDINGDDGVQFKKDDMYSTLDPFNLIRHFRVLADRLKTSLIFLG